MTLTRRVIFWVFGRRQRELARQMLEDTSSVAGDVADVPAGSLWPVDLGETFLERVDGLFYGGGPAVRVSVVKRPEESAAWWSRFPGAVPPTVTMVEWPGGEAA